MRCPATCWSNVLLSWNFSHLPTWCPFQPFDYYLAMAHNKIAAQVLPPTCVGASNLSALLSDGVYIHSIYATRNNAHSQTHTFKSNRDVVLCRAVLCLALGAVHRSKGGLSLQGVVGPSVEALQGAASRPAGSSHLWALHGLWLVANAAGPSFMPHVRASLQLAQQLLVSLSVDHISAFFCNR